MKKRAATFGLLGLFAATSGVFLPSVPVQAYTDPVSITTSPALFPAWSSLNYNYVTRCAGTNSSVSVNVAATNHVKVSVDGQPPQTGTFGATVNNYSPSQEFLITTVNSANKSATYHVRCLPTDFPTWTVALNGARQSRFYIVTPSLCINCTAYPYAAIFDANGVPVWWMRNPDKLQNGNTIPPVDAKALPDGNLLWADYISFTGGNPPIERDLAGNIVRTYPSAEKTNNLDFHDIQLLPNGNYLIATASDTVQADLTPCGAKAPNPTTGPVIDPFLEEVDPSGNLVWKWDTYTHIPMTEVGQGWWGSCRGNPNTTPPTPGDAYHWNSIEYIPGTAGHNSVLVSYRHLNALYKIDIHSSKIVWKLGGSHRAESLTMVNDPYGNFSGQHDARIDGATGDVTVHDNGTATSVNAGRPPRGAEYKVDNTAKTATFVEQVNDPSLTAICCGSARKLFSGNWVSSWGSTPHVEELTPSGTIVFNLTFTGSTEFSYRAVPVTGGTGRYGQSAGWGNALIAGMDTQYPRTPSATIKG